MEDRPHQIRAPLKMPSPESQIDDTVESMNKAKGITSTIWALVFVGTLCTLSAPACEIHIGSGAGTGGTDNSMGGAGGTANTAGPPDTWTPTPEEQASLDALQNSDPAVAGRISATNAYAAVVTQNLVAAQVLDPSTLDKATASSLFDAAAPDAISTAVAWVQSVDPALFPASAIYPKYECMEPPNECPHATKCPQFGGSCFVIDCNQGSCPGCPDFVKNLISRGWCSYACMKGTEMVGGAFILQTVFGPTQPFCIGK